LERREKRKIMRARVVSQKKLKTKATDRAKKKRKTTPLRKHGTPQGAGGLTGNSKQENQGECRKTTKKGRKFAR